MGIKKFFKIKPPEEDTVEQNRENLTNIGITVKNPKSKKTQKFAAYGQMARERAADKFYAPPGYEEYANPRGPEPEMEQGEDDDLNRAPIDPGTGLAPAEQTSPKKEQKQKRGLFGRKKSSSSKDEPPEATKPAYDPYAVNMDLNAPPSSAMDSSNIDGGFYNNTGSKGYGSSAADPYSSYNNRNKPDSYNNNNSGGYSNDPYARNTYNNTNNSQTLRDSSFVDQEDRYGDSNNNNSNNNSRSASGYDSNPYGSRGSSRRGQSEPSQANPYSNPGGNNYGSRGGNRYGEPTTTANPYGSRGSSRREISTPTGTSNPYNTYNTADPYSNTNTADQYTNHSIVDPYGGNKTDDPYSSHNNTDPYNVNYASKDQAVSAPYNGRIFAKKQPKESSIPPSLGSIGNSRGSSTSNVNPYTSMDATPYGGSTGKNKTNNPYENMAGGNVYSSSTPQSNPYEVQSTETNNFNDTQSTRYAASTIGENKPYMQKAVYMDSPNDVAVNNDMDLNETLQEYNVTGDEAGDDLNADLGQRLQQQTTEQQQVQESYNPALETSAQDQYGYYESPRLENRGFKTFDEVQREEEERQQKEEDEAVDELKQEIRFTKQSSVASTRNTLKMAQEAEMAGMNTLGMLGHQSEKLNNVERNLDLIKIQNSVADDKVAELKKLNRNILAVHVSNPFNSKRRRQEKEDRIKTKKMEEHMMMDSTNRTLEQSTQRIENAMNGNMRSDSGVREKYQRQKVLDAAKKYQFENDEEDDEMEVEIDRNLDQIKQISGRLRKLAVSTGEELEAQQQRLDRIENNTDDLDIKINMNTHKLATIK